MNVIAYSLNRSIMLRKDGSSRRNRLTALLRGLWVFHAGCYMEQMRLELPNRIKKIKLRDGQSELVKEFPFEHIVVPESGGYFSVGRDGESFYVSSLCESDHPGPSAKHCLYVDGIPVNRREKRFVEPGAEILYIDDRSRTRDVVRVVPIAI